MERLSSRKKVIVVMLWGGGKQIIDLADFGHPVGHLQTSTIFMNPKNMPKTI
jgi:hypothetical protein